MGVYVFGTVGEYVKVGHHLVTPRRPNAYYRVAGRGFFSVKHPPELDGVLGMRDLELIAWYPLLSRADETATHKRCKERYGEFHPKSELESILSFLDGRGERVSLTEADKMKAIRWAGKRKAKRRRKVA